MKGYVKLSDSAVEKLRPLVLNWSVEVQQLKSDYKMHYKDYTHITKGWIFSKRTIDVERLRETFDTDFTGVSINWRGDDWYLADTQLGAGLKELKELLSLGVNIYVDNKLAGVVQRILKLG